MNYIEDLLAEAFIAAPGCPDTIVERQLRLAASEFYRDSEAWRVTTDISPVIKGRREVDLELPRGTQLVRIFWIKLDGQPLAAVSERNLKEATGRVAGYSANGTNAALLLDVLPEQSYLRNGLQGHIAVAPLIDSDDIPDELYWQHRTGILYGAQRSLLLMPNVGWGDRRAAADLAMLFEAEKATARRIAQAQQSSVVRKVRYGGL